MSALLGRSPHAVLKTRRLRLVAITADMLRTELDSSGGVSTSVEKLVGARVPGSWPPEDWQPALLRLILGQLDTEPASVGWRRYVVLCDATGWGRTLVGAVGAFPREAGEVEIAYSTLAEFQRQGYATEAAGAFVEYLLEQEGVASVSAQAMLANPESVKVMERCGLLPAGEGDEPGTVRYRRFRG